MEEQQHEQQVPVPEKDGDHHPHHPHHHDHNSHVHFPPEQVEAHNLEIQFKYSPDRVDIHLGFLKVNHHYEVKFSIKDQLGEDVDCDHAKIKDVRPTEDGEGHEFLIHYHAHKEKLIQEIFEVRSVTDKDPIWTLYTDTELTSEGHEFLIHYHAHKEKLIQEIFEVRSVTDKDKLLTMVLHARVLGKLKGTPALKNGIRLLRVDYDEDSDALSDWQGFK